jgi:hypothetical protein
MCLDLDNVIGTKVERTIDWSSMTFKAYHCTRAIRDQIEFGGLKRFNLEERISYISKILTSHGVSKELLGKFERETRAYVSGAQLTGRDGKICFCLSRTLIDEGRDCDDFFTHFGGEAIYRVAKTSSEFELIAEALRGLGEPLVVTAKISLATCCSFQRDAVENFLRGQSSSPGEAFIHEDVPPESILGVEVRKIEAGV